MPRRINTMQRDRDKANKEFNRAYNAGVIASRRGETITDNPYLDESGIQAHQRWQYWRNGFKNAEWEQCEQPNCVA